MAQHPAWKKEKKERWAQGGRVSPQSGRGHGWAGQRSHRERRPPTVPARALDAAPRCMPRPRDPRRCTMTALVCPVQQRAHPVSGAKRECRARSARQSASGLAPPPLPPWHPPCQAQGHSPPHGLRCHPAGRQEHPPTRLPVRQSRPPPPPPPPTGAPPPALPVAPAAAAHGRARPWHTTPAADTPPRSASSATRSPPRAPPQTCSRRGPPAPPRQSSGGTRLCGTWRGPPARRTGGGPPRARGGCTSGTSGAAWRPPCRWPAAACGGGGGGGPTRGARAAPRGSPPPSPCGWRGNGCRCCCLTCCHGR